MRSARVWTPIRNSPFLAVSFPSEALHTIVGSQPDTTVLLLLIRLNPPDQTCSMMRLLAHRTVTFRTTLSSRSTNIHSESEITEKYSHSFLTMGLVACKVVWCIGCFPAGVVAHDIVSPRRRRFTEQCYTEPIVAGNSLFSPFHRPQSLLCPSVRTTLASAISGPLAFLASTSPLF